jgi:MFS family permease
MGGYVDVLRRNPSYRFIWLGGIVSLMGDWFTTVALYSMLLQFTGRGEAVGLALAARFMPFVLFGPAAGLFADRFHRRSVMIACDVLRALVVLGFLWVRTKEDVPIVYALTFAQLSISAFFEPAEQAAIASVVSREDIVTANALQGLTWSAMLALGALAGGVTTAWLGRDTSFLIDSASYVGSALLISRAIVPATPAAKRSATLSSMLGIGDIAQGIGLIRRDPRVRRVLGAKAGWGLAGGGLILLYAVFAERVFPLGSSAAAGLGVLYGARGLGALVGPLVARRMHGDDERWLQRAIGYSFVAMIAAFLLFAWSTQLGLAAFALFIGHMGASTIWVFSTALINIWVPNEMRGRIFATEGALLTLTMTGSALLTGHALDTWQLNPRSLVVVLAGMLLIPALGWYTTRARESLALAPADERATTQVGQP